LKTEVGTSPARASIGEPTLSAGWREGLEEPVWSPEAVAGGWEPWGVSDGLRLGSLGRMGT